MSGIERRTENLPTGSAVGYRTLASGCVEASPLVYPRELGPGRAVLVEELVTYNIRIPEASVTIRCPRCGVGFLAAGPTGHADDDPICDRCLLEASHQLGMVLGLVSMARSFAAIDSLTDPEYEEALDQLGAFARIYDRFAAPFGPPRYFQVPRLPEA